MEQHYDILDTHGGKPVKMWTRGVPVEQEAKEQLRKTAQMPFIYKHIAVMPDVHLGKGSTIGSVIPTVGAVIPAAVGVDIGCGMMAAKTTLRADDLPDSLGRLRSAIEALERQRIVDALEQCAGNQTHAAELLGMPRRTLVAKLAAYHIPRPRKRG